MARFNLILVAVVLGTLGLFTGLPSSSMAAANETAPAPIFRSYGLGRDTLRADDRLEKRDFIWTFTRDHDQNLCGDTTMVRVDDSGPALSACKTFASFDTDGYWLVTGFKADGSSWSRFASVQSCVLAVRRTDGGTNQVAIGNQDVHDLITTVITLFGTSGTLPTMQGNMTCHKDYAGTADVEWKLFAED